MVDKVGPRLTIIIGLVMQSIFAYFMGGFYNQLSKSIAGFCVMYGFYLAFGEFVGNCMGLISSKSSASCIRGQFYGFAAVMGKVGAFCGTYVFGDLTSNNQINDIFYISASLNLLSVALVFFFVPLLPRECIEEENLAFRTYLAENGFDVERYMGFTDGKEVYRAESKTTPDITDAKNRQHVTMSPGL